MINETSGNKLIGIPNNLSLPKTRMYIRVLVMLLGLQLSITPLSAPAETRQATPLGFLTNNAVQHFTTANDLVWDAQFQALLKTDMADLTGALLGKPQPLAETMLAVLGGPDDTIVRHDGWMIASACRQYSCDEKGLFAADMETGARGYAVIGYFSRAVAYSDGLPVLTLIYPAETPAVFRQRFGALARKWLKDKTGVEEPLESNVVEGMPQHR